MLSWCACEGSHEAHEHLGLLSDLQCLLCHYMQRQILCTACALKCPEMSLHACTAAYRVASSVQQALC